MTKTAANLITMLRNVTGRVDNTDPLFTDEIMLGYLNDFLQLDSTQDIRIFKNYTWYEFTLGTADDNPFPVDLQTIILENGTVGASTIGPPCYADGFDVFWYQSPQDFFMRWPETQTYTPQRPQYVLYYNNELLFRGPPDQDYLIKMQAYQVEIQITPQGNISADYLYRYAVYGAALNIFSDFGEMDRWNEIFPQFRRYRAFVTGRTHSQYQNQRPNPEF